MNLFTFYRYFTYNVFVFYHFKKKHFCHINKCTHKKSEIKYTIIFILQINQLERDLQQVIDEKEELVTERVAYKSKYDRLNQELNYILKGDEKRIVDIDALSMENK